MKNENLSTEALNFAQIDALTQHALSASTSADRSAKITAWLQTKPSLDLLQAAFKEMAHRDKGVAKLIKEQLDEEKQQKNQSLLLEEWSQKAEKLLQASKFNMADAMAWQRDAAKAGAPLSQAPLNTLKDDLAAKIKALEDLIHQVQIEREASVLLAQRIEILSTRSIAQAEQSREGLEQDVQNWQNRCQELSQRNNWSSIDVKYSNQLQQAQDQLQAVWQAFLDALKQAHLALESSAAPLPSVPVWAEEVAAQRQTLAPSTPAGHFSSAEKQAFKDKATTMLQKLTEALQTSITEGQTKLIGKQVHQLKQHLKEQARWMDASQQAQAQTLLAQADDLTGWQKWSTDHVREDLIQQAQALAELAQKPKASGKKIQDALRQLRDQWKQADQAGSVNQVLWKQFDEICSQSHQVVEKWLAQIKAEAAAHWEQRMALLQKLKDWTQTNENNQDWKAQHKDLQHFAEEWRVAGHLSEKQFSEIQTQWKTAMQAARKNLETAQQASQIHRQNLIKQAEQLAQKGVFRIDAIKNLQQEWQQEALRMPIDRRIEQKMWENFRTHIDALFAKKQQAREQSLQAANAYETEVLKAIDALNLACKDANAQAIQQALQELNLRLNSLPETPATTAAATEAPTVEANTKTNQEEITASPDTSTTETALPELPEQLSAPSAAEETPAPAANPVKKPLIAVRGDDRPGMQKSTPVTTGKPFEKSGHKKGSDRLDHKKSAPNTDFNKDRAPRLPRLSDGIFRAQRNAIDQARHMLTQLASQAHGHALMQLMEIWQNRNAEALQSMQDPEIKLNAQTRNLWVKALKENANESNASTQNAFIRLEMAAELPTAAEFLNDRRKLQLQMLTERQSANSPSQTWIEDVGCIFKTSHNEANAKRLQSCLKVLLKRNK